MSEIQHAQTTTTNAFPILIAEEAHRDHQATEALLLTFNVDLGFFEARLLGVVRATGARVTVIADARAWSPDTRAVRYAGRSYHLGLVDSGSAFHPKLLVLAGPQRAIAGIGSGNLTMGGWQYNRELLTVFTGNRADGVPTAFVDVRNLIASLNITGALDPIASAAATRTVTALDGLLAAAGHIDTGHHVYASWDGPLLNRLPAGPVEELYLSAAFHDPKSEAVRRILHRLRPRTVKVAVQPGGTHLDPARLHAVLTRFADDIGGTWELLADPESMSSPHARYRHGKLIEWVTRDGERHALTGSPNLSHVALVSDVTGGGNHEIAVVGPTEPLFPGGIPVSHDEIPTLPVVADEPEAAGITAGAPVIRVLAAVRAEGSVEVHLNRASGIAVRVEMSDRTASPDDWAHLGDIPPNTASTVFVGGVMAGSRIRAAYAKPETGALMVTAPVYVTDAMQVRMRSTPDKHASRTHRAVAADLFGEDIALLDSLSYDLAQFARDLSNARQPIGTRKPSADRQAESERDRSVDTAEPWLWLQEETVRSHGPGLASWLLALPSLGLGTGGDVPWADKINDDAEVGLEDEDTEATTQEVAQTQAVPDDAPESLDHTRDTDWLRSKRRGWAAKANAIALDLPVSSRLLILRVTLAFWSAGNWPENDPEPFNLTRSLIDALTGPAVDEHPDELRERVGALIAVALTMMRQRVDVTTRNVGANAFHAAVKAGSPYLSVVAENTVDAYVTGLRTIHEGPLTTGHVMALGADLSSDDPFAAVVTAMEERGYDATRPASNVLHIHAKIPNPQPVAVDALAMAEEHSGIAVWVTSHRGNWALAAWNRPDLVTVWQQSPHKPRWRHQRLDRASVTAVASMVRRGDTKNMPGHVTTGHYVNRFDATDAARAVLASVGIDDPEPPFT